MRLKLHIIALLVLSFSLSQLSAQSNAMEKFEMANKLYQQEEYKKATNLYKELLQEKFVSEDLHYNLANSYFKTKKIAPAILHYEKALKINSSHQDAQHNLKLANQKTVDKIELIPELFIYRWWKAIYNATFMDNWAKLAILAFFLSALLFFSFLFSSTLRLKKISFYTACIFFLFGGINWFLAAQQKSYLNSKSHAIIMAPTVNIISAPSAGSSQLFVLHEGTKVKIKDETDAWIEVALPNGNQGWLEKIKVETI